MAMSFNSVFARPFVDNPPSMEDEYMYRLSIEAAEALAAAATMRVAPRRLHDDALSLEAAEALTDVAHMHSRPPPPPPFSSPPTDTDSPPQQRGKYRCGRCGQMKVNHICPMGRAPVDISASNTTSAPSLAMVSS